MEAVHSKYNDRSPEDFFIRSLNEEMTDSNGMSCAALMILQAQEIVVSNYRGTFTDQQQPANE